MCDGGVAVVSVAVPRARPKADVCIGEDLGLQPSALVALVCGGLCKPGQDAVVLAEALGTWKTGCQTRVRLKEHDT